MIHDEDFPFPSVATTRVVKQIALVKEDWEARNLTRGGSNPFYLWIKYVVSDMKDANLMFEYELLRREGVPPARRNAALFMKYM